MTNDNDDYDYDYDYDFCSSCYRIPQRISKILKV